MANSYWAAPWLPHAILSVTPLKQGLQHRTDWVCLIDDSQWVCKLLAKKTWLGDSDFHNIQFTEQLAATVSQQLGLTFSAYQSPLLTSQAMGIIKPYCLGTQDNQVSVRQAEILGEVVAKIHALNFVDQHAKPFPPIHYAGQISDPQWLKNLIAQCNQQINYQASASKISHRDLSLDNIVWRNEDQVHILDWESAGLIHPFVELIGVATNCAGIVLGVFDQTRFEAVLTGYLHQSPLPEADEILWTMTFHSWLLWYSFCEQQQWLSEMRAALMMIEQLRSQLPTMKIIYHKRSRPIHGTVVFGAS